jgi:hypothetical protein
MHPEEEFMWLENADHLTAIMLHNMTVALSAAGIRRM